MTQKWRRNERRSTYGKMVGLSSTAQHTAASVAVAASAERVCVCVCVFMRVVSNYNCVLGVQPQPLQRTRQAYAPCSNGSCCMSRWSVWSCLLHIFHQFRHQNRSALIRCAFFKCNFQYEFDVRTQNDHLSIDFRNFSHRFEVF